MLRSSRCRRLECLPDEPERRHDVSIRRHCDQ
jgi:hypothetical protein